MLKKFLLLVMLMTGLLTVHSFNVSAQKTDPAKREAILLKTALEKNHYSPIPFDNIFSERVFNDFIKALDPQGIYLTVAEYSLLREYRLVIDDDINGSSWKFLPEAIRLFKQRLLETDKELDQLSTQPISFSTSDSIFFIKDDDFSFSKDKAELLKRWNKVIKYKALWQIVEEEEKTGKLVDISTIEQSIRSKVIQKEKRNIRRILEAPEGFEAYITKLFLNSISSVFDPHSNYFSKTDWESFEKFLSMEALSFGWNLKENESGNVVISHLLPGGAAWKTNELHKGDKLLQLQSGKSKIDLNGADIDEVDQWLETVSGKVEVTVKKAGGMIKTVALAKEKSRQDENIVKSFILEGNKRIGYISLPGFYTEWENTNGLGCSNDVAKEILKLKEEKIQGLILDIRYNGGGALHEGSNLAGIFINEGPLFILQGKDKKPVVMKDMNRGTIYNDPLLVMINGQSASASEILASTLQDFNRAVIVGSPSFGKATGQNVLPMDTTIKPLNSKIDGAVLKVTEMKIYRITGKSIQQKGIIPDISLPDLYEGLDFKESSLPLSLPNDSVNKKVIFNKLKPLPIDLLAKNSMERVSKNESFRTVSSLKKGISTIYSEEYGKAIPLNINDFRKWNVGIMRLQQSIEKIEANKSNSFSIKNTHYDNDVNQVDTCSKEFNDTLKENLSKDIYLDESFQILTDLINLSQTK